MHMDQHIFDQWSISHAVWGFMLGYLCKAPRRIEAWKIGLLFVFWEFWENVIEVAFSTYAPGQCKVTAGPKRPGPTTSPCASSTPCLLTDPFVSLSFGLPADHGDSLVNSLFDMIPSMSGVWMGRHLPSAWPAFLLAEAWATSMGCGIHSVFLGHQGSICDIRADPLGCGMAYVLRLLLLPWVFCGIEGLLWRFWDGKQPAVRGERVKDDSSSPIVSCRNKADAMPEGKTVKKRAPNLGGPTVFKQ